MLMLNRNVMYIATVPAIGKRQLTSNSLKRQITSRDRQICSHCCNNADLCNQQGCGTQGTCTCMRLMHVLYEV